MQPLLSEMIKKERWDRVLPYIQGDILDIGCSWTSLPDRVAELTSYTGVDTNLEALTYCRKKYPQHQFLQCDLDTEELNPGRTGFTVIVMAAVIEHLRYPEQLLRRLHPLLAPTGHLLITTPSPLGDKVHQIGGRIGLFYSEETVQHITIFNRRTLTDIATAAGYKVIRYQPFLFGTNQLLVAQP